MDSKSHLKRQPVSRELARIIRENSRLEPRGEPAGLGGHVSAIEERQSKALEFYLRGCALRLG